MSSLSEFYDALNIRNRRVKGERFGQCLFNHLAEVRPDLSEKIRATDMDPFYWESHDPRWQAFETYLESIWYASSVSNGS